MATSSYPAINFDNAFTVDTRTVGSLEGPRFPLLFIQTTLCSADDDIIQISLTPTINRPRTRHLPKGYDTYFSIDREPAGLADGLDDTLIFVRVDTQTFSVYIKNILKKVIGEPNGTVLFLKGSRQGH